MALYVSDFLIAFSASNPPAAGHIAGTDCLTALSVSLDFELSSLTLMVDMEFATCAQFCNPYIWPLTDSQRKTQNKNPQKTTTAMIVGNSRDGNCNNNNIHDDDNDDNHDDDDNQEDNDDDNDDGDDDDSDDDDNRSQLHEWIHTVVCTYCPPLEPSRQERGNVDYCGMFCACLLRHVPPTRRWHRPLSARADSTAKDIMFINPCDCTGSLAAFS